MSVFDGFKPYSESRKINSVVCFNGRIMPLADYLAERFTYRTRDEWLNEISAGNFLLDDVRITENIPIQNNQHITYEFTAKDEPECNLNYTLLGINDDFICVSKSGNLPTHPAGRYYQNTLWYLMQKDFGPCAPINRLDRETSGIILFGRNPEAVRFFSRCNMQKKYHVIVHGEFPEQLDADGFIMKDKSSSIRKKRRFSYTADTESDTETCHTVFKRLNFKNGLSLIEAELKTGRTHQIRATCSSLGYPVAGDKMYGPDENIFLRFIEGKMTEEDKNKLLFSRQALHAYYLAFTTASGKSFEFTAPFDIEKSVFNQKS